MVDVVDLRIEAENVASAQLLQVAEDVTGLGRAAERTQRELEDLEINRNTLNSFDQAQQRVAELEQQVEDTTVALQRSQAELRNNAEATDEQRRAVVQQQQQLRRLNADLTASNRELRTLGNTLGRAGVSTEDLAASQATLNTRIEETRREANRLSTEYDRQTDNLRERIEQQRRVNQAEEEAQRIQRETRQEAERTAAAEAERLSAQRRATEEQSRLTIATGRYEQALERLNQELNQGRITQGNYIRAESRLRRELNLSAQQVNTSRRAIEADTRTKADNVARTSALANVTRTLAAAYVALESAQAAAEQVGASVAAYGSLEAAITNVARTTGIARDEVTTLANTIRELGQDITPTATSELLRYAEVAGQLGTNSTQDLLRLVAAADQLNIATNIAGDEAAVLLTRILGLTGQGTSAIGNLSSSVVQLGNNFAAQESEIVDFGRQLATSTRDIDLSAQAALALGTALAVSGNQAEASTTAIGRLSQAIRQAATEGGDSLERLAEITGQTGEQIQENLGGNSEQIILDFAAGLARVQEQGGITLDVLNQFGIDGQEAARVFGSLSANVDVLRDAINQSNEAFIDGTAQIREASQAYANQESAVGRLRNTFTSLQEEIGRALGDETDAALRALDQGLSNASGEAANLAEILPDIATAIIDVVGVLDNLAAVVGTDLPGAIDTLGDGVDLVFGGIINSANLVTAAIQGFALSVTEAVSGIAELFDSDFGTEFANSLREALRDTAADIESSTDRVNNALSRLAGDSSRAYEDLIQATQNYNAVLNRLTTEEQAQIDIILNKTGFIEGQDQQYRLLTESIVRANRVAEIEAAQIEFNNQLRDNSTQSINREVQARQDGVQVANDAIAANVNLAESNAELSERLQEVADLEQAGILTKEVAANFTELLTNQITNQAAAQERLTATTQAATESVQQQSITAEQLLQQNQALFAQYEQGEISISELTNAQAELIAQYSGAREQTQQLTDTQLALEVQIIRSVESIRQLNTELNNAANSAADTARITAQLRQEEEQLADLRAQQAQQAEIANATATELNAIRERTLQQLQTLNERYRAGAITTGEFVEQEQQLQSVLSQINSILGESTQLTEENTQAVVQNVQAKEQQAEVSQRVASFLSLELQAQQSLSQQYDFSDASLSDLNQRLTELQGNIIQNNRVLNPWLRNLAEISNESFRREQAFISETLALRQFTAQVQAGTLDLQELDALAANADRTFTNLGAQQLAGLRNAIADARREFQALDDSINAALDSTQDRLDRIRGDEAAIVRRQFEREREELQMLLDQALITGNQRLVDQITQAIQNLQQAQELEFRERFPPNQTGARGQQQATQQAQPANNTTTNRSNSGNIVLSLRSGDTTTNVGLTDQQSANSLISFLEQAGLTSNEGNV